MYNGVMGRTQVYLDDSDLELLERATRATGASRSELIRRAIRRSYGELSTAEKLAALEASAGSWKDRDFTGAEYVAAIRSDSAARRRRLGLV